MWSSFIPQNSSSRGRGQGQQLNLRQCSLWANPEAAQDSGFDPPTPESPFLSLLSGEMLWVCAVCILILLPALLQRLLSSGRADPQVKLWHLHVPAAQACAEQMKDYSDQFGEKGDFSPSVHPQGSISS